MVPDCNKDESVFVCLGQRLSKVKLHLKYSQRKGPAGNFVAIPAMFEQDFWIYAGFYLKR